MDDKIHILLCTDEKYIMPTGVLMLSINKNNDCSVHYYIFTSGNFTQENKNVLSSIARDGGNDITFYGINEDNVKDFRVSISEKSHLSIATFYRLYVASILPYDVHKILYLDGDIIVRKSLMELWQTDMSKHAIAAVHYVREQELNLPCDKLYTSQFNAGVLIINLDYWRKNNVQERLLEYGRANVNALEFHDQSILNAVLYKEKINLPIKYNITSQFLSREYIHRTKDAEQQICNPTIIHYTERVKPWHKDSKHPFANEWRKYYAMSQWAGIRLTESPYSPKKSILKLSSIKRFFTIAKEKKKSNWDFCKIVIGNILMLLGVEKDFWKKKYKNYKLIE